MLILNRYEGERIQIGKDIWVTILDVKGNRVTVGIDAPKDVPVVRDDAKEREAKA